MRPPRTSLALAALAAVAVSACSPKYYAPNTHNVPVLTRAHDWSGVAAVGDSRVEIQGAFAVTDRFALLLDGAAFDKKDEADGDGGEGGLLEVGAGYLATLGNGGGSRVQLGIFGLLGGGNVENHFPSTLAANPGTTGIIEARLSRFGVQPTVSFRSTYFEAVGSVRVLGLRYSDVEGSLIFGGEDQVQMLRAQSEHTLLEPALTVRAGLETWKVQIQLGWSVNREHSSFRQDGGHLTAGVVYSPR